MMTIALIGVLALVAAGLLAKTWLSVQDDEPGIASDAGAYAAMVLFFLGVALAGTVDAL